MAMRTGQQRQGMGLRNRDTAAPPRPGDPRMRQGTGYAYGSGEDCISYKCEGCGKRVRVRVTPAQALQLRGAFTACSRIWVLKARDLRTRQLRLSVGDPEPSEVAALAGTLGSEAGAVQERDADT